MIVENEEIINLANQLKTKGLGTKDALHIGKMIGSSHGVVEEW